MINKKLSPLKSIKQYCKEQCCAGDRESWLNCSIVDCLLYPFRLGKRQSSKTHNSQKIINKTIKNQEDSEKDDK